MPERIGIFRKEGRTVNADAIQSAKQAETLDLLAMLKGTAAKKKPVTKALPGDNKVAENKPADDKTAENKPPEEKSFVKVEQNIDPNRPEPGIIFLIILNS